MLNSLNISGALLAAFILIAPVQAESVPEQPLMVDIKRMSLDTALKIAKAALLECRNKHGVQVAVTVVDRSGQPQVVLRDVLASGITLPISQQKSFTAVMFNSSTKELPARFTHPFSVGKVDGLLFQEGGLPITAGGTLLGGVGISGAPSSEIDAACAQAGIEAVIDDLEMEM